MSASFIGNLQRHSFEPNAFQIASLSRSILSQSERRTAQLVPCTFSYDISYIMMDSIKEVKLEKVTNRLFSHF